MSNHSVPNNIPDTAAPLPVDRSDHGRSGKTNTPFSRIESVDHHSHLTVLTMHTGDVGMDLVEANDLFRTIWMLINKSRHRLQFAWLINGQEEKIDHILHLVGRSFDPQMTISLNISGGTPQDRLDATNLIRQVLLQSSQPTESLGRRISKSISGLLFGNGATDQAVN